MSKDFLGIINFLGAIAYRKTYLYDPWHALSVLSKGMYFFRVSGGGAIDFREVGRTKIEALRLREAAMAEQGIAGIAAQI